MLRGTRHRGAGSGRHGERPDFALEFSAFHQFVIESGDIRQSLVGRDPRVEIVPEIMLNPHELIYHVTGESLPDGMHHLHFDGMALADDQHIDFLRNGERAASICPVEVDGEKSLQLWTLWNAWRADHEVEFYHGVTAALRDLDDDAE